MTRQAVKLFIFDLGKVLIDFDFSIAIQRLENFGKVDPSKVQGLFRTSSLSKKWDAGLMNGDEFFKTVRDELELTIPIGQFLPIWNEIFTENKETIRLAEILNQSSRVLILSNTNPWHAEYIRENFPWIHHFYDFIASCDVHLLKPDPEIFKLALKRGNANPYETLYVDDMEENVRQTKSLGFDSILFTGISTLLPELKKRGIKIPASLVE